MALDAFRGDRREGRAQQPRQPGQGSVLRVRVRFRVGPLQFDAKGEVVARLATVEAGNPGMPGAVVTGDELGDGAVAFDEEMRGNRQVADLLEIGMFVRVQAILEERLDLAGAELSRRQADIVDDQQRHRVPLRTQVEIR